MKKIIFILFPLFVLFLVACGSDGQDGISIEDVWGRPAPKSARNTAFYLAINNAGPKQDALVGVSIDICDAAELHMSNIDGDGVMSMRQVQQIDVPAGETTSLEPGGYHIMCLGRQTELNPGDRVPISLSFTQAGEITAEAEIREQ